MIKRFFLRRRIRHIAECIEEIQEHQRQLSAELDTYLALVRRLKLELKLLEYPPSVGCGQARNVAR